ncbi:MAG: archaeal proteasome endopeptidase complex subunit alpha [archaeon GB-1867-097]|nr:archaeal proteasome endopeptidase complex subunit alpha [Candidatus Culexmicrobium thermophilum]MCS7384152.1 archaeal proteasome endopeptidase complex subunit alpha [Candidatus Culexmicrobium thermophilum]RLE54916.1 MAG: proteasome endopeptidase complex, archaeal, alpha subunit [Candidatus Verstraetearchaeota archaeon]HDO21016.1 archaeal proteasome endopeptidase complex subunit alpha [Candidatus Bathyarchaeota archaeon]
MFTPPGMGYDRAITVFSPDGRLFQVEYAMEAVRKGFTTLGIKCSEGIVLVAEKRKLLPLIDFSSLEKIFKVDEHIGMTYAGFPFDARVLIDRARTEAQINRILYDEPIDVEVLTRKISDIMQLYTQHGGVRPFGVSLLIAGVDLNGPRLFMTEPSGAYAGYMARVIGAGSQPATEYLEKNYRHDLTLNEALILGINALKPVIEGALEPQKLEIGVISIKDGKFRKLSEDEIAGKLKQIG